MLGVARQIGQLVGVVPQVVEGVLRAVVQFLDEWIVEGVPLGGLDPGGGGERFARPVRPGSIAIDQGEGLADRNVGGDFLVVGRPHEGIAVVADAADWVDALAVVDDSLVAEVADDEIVHLGGFAD